MKRGQKLIVVCLNQASLGASEAVHESMYDKIPEAIRYVEKAQGYLTQAIVYLKARDKSQRERG